MVDLKALSIMLRRYCFTDSGFDDDNMTGNDDRREEGEDKSKWESKAKQRDVGDALD